MKRHIAESGASSHRPFAALSNRRPWWSAVALTMVLPTLLVAAKFGEIGPPALILLGILALAVGLFFLTVPQTPFLPIVFGNLLGLYMGLFTLLTESNFIQVSTAAAIIGYVIPVSGFFLGSLLNRADIRRLVQEADDAVIGEAKTPLNWLVPIAVLVLLTYQVEHIPQNVLSINTIFLVMMGITGLVVLVMSRQVCAFIVYTALVFEGFFSRLRNLAVPAFVFISLYSILVMGFGALYRLASLADPEPLFLVDGEARVLEFGEALYFSIVTLSTVGYGDIAPITTGMRLLVSMQILLGVLLLLFGVSEIMGHARRKGRERGD